MFFWKADEFLSNIEKQRDLSRVLVHIDMDAFYANVEIRDNPTLADKPMAVGSDSMLVRISLFKKNKLQIKENIFLKSTSNYIARRFGVRAAMPGIDI